MRTFRDFVSARRISGKDGRDDQMEGKTVSEVAERTWIWSETLEHRRIMRNR